MKLSVIIVSYNVKYFLEQCLRSVERSIEGLACEIIVVDNNSTDGSKEYLTPRFPHVKFIWNSDNKGFARANNQAINISKAEYILLLNPDTIIGENTIREYIDFMDRTPDAGGAGAYMLRTDGTFAPESRRGLPTPFVAFCKMSGLAGLFPKSHIFGRYYMRYLDENKINRIEIISGAFMFLRRKTLDKAGVLDESFFMYGEDIDLSYRILKSGYNNYFLPSRILHYKGESTVKSSYRYVYTFYQAMQIFFNKHYSHYSILVSLPISMAIWSRAMLAYIGNKFSHSNPTEETQKMNMIVVGSKDMIKEVKEILEKKQSKNKHLFIEGNEETLPQGHLETKELEQFDTVVYDSDSYSYNTILKLLEQTPGNNLKIATYSTKSRILITEGETYNHEKR